MGITDKSKFNTGIIRRWLLSVFLIFTVSIIGVSICICVFIRNTYYETAKNFINSSASDVAISYFTDIDTNSAEFLNSAKFFVDSFNKSGQIEVWVINSSGKVIVSSSGIKQKEKVNAKDYSMAMQSGTGSYEWIGKNDDGEKIIAKTVKLNSSGGAVRFISSLRDVDMQLIRLTISIFSISLIFIALLLVLGFLFISSLAKSIKAVNVTAQQFAEGDLDAQLDDYEYRDEIGDLYKTFNNMTKEISQADRLKNDFISTISHELRTPLTAIKGWGETLLQIGETDPEMSKKGMQVIINEAGRLTGMVEDLLDFSRMEGGNMVLHTKKIDVLAELDETVFVFKERAARDGIEVVYTAPHFAAPMTGDPDRIKQVFVNILDNSMKYTKQGGKIILLAEFREDNKIEIIISDDGCGISEEDLPHVKEKFFKNNNTVRGSGIGLAVADEIVRLHDGELNINSKLGEGTTVTIVLPVDSIPTEEEERGLVDEQE